MTGLRALPAFALTVALTVAVTGAACSSDTAPAKVPAATAGAAEVRADAVPAELLGLHSAPEDVSAQLKKAEDRAFVNAVRMWSLREGDRLRATIEVARFAPDASPERPSFQRSIVAQIGTSAPRQRRVEDQTVYVTVANKQAIFMWFRNLHFVLLSTSTEYTSPRALVRAAVQQVQP